MTLSAFITTSIICGFAVAAPETVSKPNVIVILVDDLGYGDTGCYGAKPEHIKTPGIDRLAKEGLRFTDAHSPAAVCTPSRYSLLTGEYAFRNRKEWGILPGDAPLGIKPGSFTLPEMFRSTGYQTGFVGKWHLGLGDGGTVDWNGEIKPGPRELGFTFAFFMPATGDRVPTVFVRDRRVENLDPADPIQVNYKQKTGNWPTGIENPDQADVLCGAKGAGHQGTITRGISRMGWMTGGKYNAFEGGTRVPFIVRWPGHVTAGTTSPALLSLTDLQSSLARLLDITLPAAAAVDSMDLAGALVGKSPTGRHELVEHQYGPDCALRVGQWKWIKGQLFDLSNDLSETRDLAKEQPERAKAMAARLDEIRASDRTRS